MSIELQESIVREIVENIKENWDRLTVNIEIDDIDGELVSSDESDTWQGETSEEFDLTFEASEYFENLRDSMAQFDKESRNWTICDLEILSDGNYKFNFSYDKPPRLSELG